MLDEPPGCGVKCHNPAPLIFTKLAKPAFLAFVRNTTEVGGAVWRQLFYLVSVVSSTLQPACGQKWWHLFTLMTRQFARGSDSGLGYCGGNATKWDMAGAGAGQEAAARDTSGILRQNLGYCGGNATKWDMAGAGPSQEAAVRDTSGITRQNLGYCGGNATKWDMAGAESGQRTAARLERNVGCRAAAGHMR